MMIRTLALLVPVTITPLLAVETIESVLIRGPLSHISITVQDGPMALDGGRSDVVSGLSVIPASAAQHESAWSGLNLLHSLRF